MWKAASHLLAGCCWCQDLAVLDLVATLAEEQGQGHCTALVGALESWLGPQMGVASLMAVCPDKVSWLSRISEERREPAALAVVHEPYMIKE